MKKTTERMIEEVNELKELCIKELFDPDQINGMDEKVFLLYKKMFKLMDTSMKVVLKQAELMEEQSRKLDKLLSKAKEQ